LPMPNLNKTSRTFVTVRLGSLLAVLLCVGGSFPHPSARAEGQGTEPIGMQDSGETTNATIVTGPMTPKQLVHSRIHCYERPPEARRTISFLVANHADKKEVGLHEEVNLFETSRTPEQRIADLVDASDAILVGTVVEQASNLTADDGFLFTDYEIRTIAVLKGNPRAPIREGDVVTVTRRGGRVIIDGTLVTAMSNLDPPLGRGPDPLILFLKYLPESDDYICAGPHSALALRDNSIVPLVGDPRFGRFDRFDAFSELVKSLVPAEPRHK
jgi:hypothetical protein